MWQRIINYILPVHRFIPARLPHTHLHGIVQLSIWRFELKIALHTLHYLILATVRFPFHIHIIRIVLRTLDNNSGNFHIRTGFRVRQVGTTNLIFDCETVFLTRIENIDEVNYPLPTFASLTLR